MLETVAILGAGGAIGIHVAAELQRRQIPVIAVGRDTKRLCEVLGNAEPGEDRGLTVRGADLSTPEGARVACAGATSIVYAVGAPYHQFELHPKMMQHTVDAAIAEGVRRLVVISSVYSYGEPQTERVAEDHPREPVARKGQFRKQQEDIALAAHAGGKLQTVVLHLPDFLGPHAKQSFSTTLFEAALGNKKANWLGDPSLQHEFVYVPDVAPVVAALLAREDVWGERYNLAGSGLITGQDLIHQIYYAACRRPRYRTAGKSMLQLMGLFNPLMRELVEMQYLMETPVFLDDRKLQGKLGSIQRTPYANAITATIAWLRGIPSLA